MPDRPQPGARGAVPFRRRVALSVTLGLALVALIVGTWPRDAVPTFRTACDTCVSLGGGDTSGTSNHAVFADSSTARFFQHLLPYYAGLWFLVSPLGYAAVVGVRWAANRLHEARK